ncbi:ABC transporter substrate-binding protein [Flexivirga alba]|uniref:ABC transporter substrate-binding protein n=1 Tax=Flexivirga alba TaxID=702742 RepID=A0ABW2AKL6_9MICO
MMRWKNPVTALAAIAALSLTVSGCTGGSKSSNSNGSSGKTLVVNNNFDLKTLDPARAFEFTDVMIEHQVYETALTYHGNETSKLYPEVATYSRSSDDRVVTLKLTGDHQFADGSKVTADDIVFSYNRLEGIGGNPSFLLNDPSGKPVVVKKSGPSTVTLTSSVANPALPSILPNPALSILEKKVLVAHGGTTTSSDKAQKYLDEHSLGSATYQITNSQIATSVSLGTNPHYTGTAPGYSKVVIQNVVPATQKVNLQSGTAQLALDVDPQSAAQMVNSKKFAETASPSLNTIYAWFNTDAKYGGPVANNNFVLAVRHAIDYSSLIKLAGPGSTQPGGVIPEGIIGALKSDSHNTYDPVQAKRYLKKSGYHGQPIKFTVDSQASAGNASYTTIAQKIQAQLSAVGINLNLVPQPSVTSLSTYRSGTFPAGLASWGADYPDPSDYIAFGPGQNLGKRVAWKTGTSSSADKVEPLLTTALTTSDPSKRVSAWESVQKQMNADGPFVPLLQPGALIIYAAGIKNVPSNPIWTTEFRDIK